jgi:ribosomal 30S subunit maturation factor RimM
MQAPEKLGQIVGVRGLNGQMKCRLIYPMALASGPLGRVGLALPNGNRHDGLATVQTEPGQGELLTVYVTVEGITDRTQAEQWRFATVTAQLPEDPDTLAVGTLVGKAVWQVETQTQVGEVVGVLSHGGQDFLEIQTIPGDTGTSHPSPAVVPFLKHFFPGRLRDDRLWVQGLEGFFEPDPS